MDTILKNILIDPAVRNAEDIEVLASRQDEFLSWE
jgi:hypothetical protein